MAAVKGSAQYRMVVMPYRPMRRVFNYFCIFMLLLLVAVGCFFYGYDQGVTQQPVRGLISHRSQELTQLQQEAEALRQEVANLKLAAQVDAQAYEEVRRQTLEQRAKIAELEQDIVVYRGMISKVDTTNPRGISLGTFQVSGSGGVRGYKYKFVIQQLVLNEEAFKGTMRIDIVGTRGVQRMTIPLAQASMQVADEWIPLDFKYFQSIEGDLLLPEGFEPERVDILVKSVDRKKPTHLERQLNWSVTN